jgi:hypothetical protein
MHVVGCNKLLQFGNCETVDLVALRRQEVLLHLQRESQYSKSNMRNLVAVKGVGAHVLTTS